MSTFSNEDVEDFHSSILANDLDAVKLYLRDADCGDADENGESDGARNAQSVDKRIISGRDNRNRCALHIAALEGVSNEMFNIIVKASTNVDLPDVRKMPVSTLWV